MIRDFRYAWRQLQRAPGFAFLAVFTLALGIGANTAMFTVIESVLLRPLPYANPDRLVYVGPADSPGLGSTSWLNYRDVRDQAQSLEIVAGYSEDVGVVQSKEASVSVVTPGVTPNLFRLLGAQPLLGRTFAESEGRAGGSQVAMISEGLWSEVFARDPHIMGQIVRVNGRDRTVVGVMPRSFRFPESMGPGRREGLVAPHSADGGDAERSWLPLLYGSSSTQAGGHPAPSPGGVDHNRPTHPAERFARRCRPGVPGGVL